MDGNVPPFLRVRSVSRMSVIRVTSESEFFEHKQGVTSQLNAPVRMQRVIRMPAHIID